MPVATAITSAAGPLALLYDDDQEVRTYALQRLQAIVPQFWAEISDHTSAIEEIYFSGAGQPAEYHLSAALLASKTYYYMGILEEAITFALSAGRVFEKEPASEYKQTIIAGCIDRAIAETSKGEKLGRDLQAVVDAVLNSQIGEDGKLAVGLALSLRRLDLIESLFRNSRAPPQASTSTAAVQTSKHDESLLRYVLSEAVSGTTGSENLPVDFRDQLLGLLSKLFLESPSPDYNSITTIWVQTSDSTGAGKALAKLMKSDDQLEAYQIAFDLAEVASQQFVLAVKAQLQQEGLKAGERGQASERKRFGEEGQKAEDLLDDILSGEVSAELHLNFLSKANQTDMSILKVTKDSLEDRYSIYHSAITFTNAYASCGTTSDRFLRENLDFLGRANNWAKFSTTAALGLIHRGSWVNGERVLQPYLPNGSSPNSYSEGGALFALGLIYAGRKEKPEEELRNSLQITDPVVQHGAALGLGVSALGTADEAIYGDLQQALFQDDATIGEAAGYAMGLIMLGTASEKAIDEMLSYARETQHEKIIRSLAVGLALVMYGQRERADAFIEKMAEEKDSILRYGGMFTIGLAYAGTGSNKAVKRLLHVAVSDVSDDVRRAAVTALGFVLFRNHTQVPRVVQLLSESYNPHVRHGATLALGISCAGTGLEAAVNLLEPMTKDPVDFVRQGAYISLALVLIQQSEAQSPKSASIREMFSKVTGDKHEDPMARFGASIAQGIIDAGGRNMTLSLSTRAGTLNTNAIVGLTLFVQLWYWFPLAHGLGLAFSPTAIIALDEKLHVPKVDLTVHAKPSTFAYYTGPKEKKEEEKKKTTAAVLSTTARAKARAKSKKQAESGDVDMDEQTGAGSTEATAATPKKAAPAKPTEPSTFTIQNMSRVTPLQSALVSFPSEGRYVPIRPIGDSAAIAQADKAAAASSSASSTGKKSLGSHAAGSARGGVITSSSIVLLKTAADKAADSASDAEFIELDRNLWPYPSVPAPVEEAATATAAPGQGPVGPGAAMSQQLRGDGSAADAPTPAPFEYPFDD